MPVTINGTTGIAGVDGSAGTPAIQGSDTNTGIRFGTDTVGLVTGGSDRLFIDSSGRVGIGDSGPAHKLVVRQNNSGGVAAIHLPEDESTILGSTANTNIKMGGNLSLSAGSVFVLNTNGSERVRVTSTGLVGIGDTAPGQKLVLRDSGDVYLQIQKTGVNGMFIGSESSIGVIASDNPIVFRVGSAPSATERARIDSSGRLLVGTSSARTNVFRASSSFTAPIQIDSVTNSYSNGINILNYSLSGFSGILTLGMSKSNTQGTNAIVGNNDELGGINFVGNDGTNFRTAVLIEAQVDGVPGAGDMPGRLVFSTTADGATTPTERMRIVSNGTVLIGKTSLGIGNAGIELDAAAQDAMFTTFGATPVFVNRTSNDGVLIDFQQDSTTEGSISVSGTTVQLNGAHLSRWSQLSGGDERTEILRGTVLSNIDEMCEWGDEENEQLNRMKISDVEGDKNVAGVFVTWDDDDDTYTNDFYCAMTGDFIIRIAAGVTVERGDLLMSAGDGTAKPQGDVYIQDKTIAKVTSTHVTYTYDDGSYCVPCVLMAC